MNFPQAKPKIVPEQIQKAEQVLIDNGIDPVEAQTVQALGCVHLDEELYPESGPGGNPEGVSHFDTLGDLDAHQYQKTGD